MQACLVPARELARWIFRLGGEAWAAHVGLFVFGAIMLQGVSGLIGIALMRRLLPHADSHLRWPRERSYVGLSIAIGVAMGLVMLVADYWPDLLHGRAPAASYSLQPSIAAGWLLAMITTGLGEETIFRGLLVGLLAALMPGRVRLGRFEISTAGVLVALLFGVAHYQSFFQDPLSLAIAQQLYAFVWGLVYVWLMEKSDSLLAPIVAHGVGNFVEVASVMLLTAAAS
jgi:membrane protease YdiL (CAAX protease family)